MKGFILFLILSTTTAATLMNRVNLAKRCDDFQHAQIIESFLFPKCDMDLDGLIPRCSAFGFTYHETLKYACMYLAMNCKYEAYVKMLDETFVEPLAKASIDELKAKLLLRGVGGNFETDAPFFEACRGIFKGVQSIFDCTQEIGDTKDLFLLQQLDKMVSKKENITNLKLKLIWRGFGGIFVTDAPFLEACKDVFKGVQSIYDCNQEIGDTKDLFLLQQLSEKIK